MSGPWKMFTFLSGEKVLVNTSLIESVREDKRGTGARLYAPGASLSESYLLLEPFDLVVAMLTEQPDEPAREQST